MDYQYDIAVIGAGPGGYETAIKAAQMGKKTCIIESTYLGGTCLNVGCIPTKTLIKTANVLDTVKHAADFAVEGVDLSALKVDMAKCQKRRQKVVSTLVGGAQRPAPRKQGGHSGGNGQLCGHAYSDSGR